MLNLDTDQLFISKIAHTKTTGYFRCYGLINGAITEVTQQVANLCGFPLVNQAFQLEVPYPPFAYILGQLEAATGVLYAVEGPTPSAAPDTPSDSFKRGERDYQALYLQAEGDIQDLKDEITGLNQRIDDLLKEQKAAKKELASVENLKDQILVLEGKLEELQETLDDQEVLINAAYDLRLHLERLEPKLVELQEADLSWYWTVRGLLDGLKELRAAPI